MNVFPTIFRGLTCFCKSEFSLLQRIMFLFLVALCCSTVFGLDDEQDIHRWMSPRRIRGRQTSFEPIHEILRSPSLDRSRRPQTPSAAGSRAVSPAISLRRPMTPLPYHTLVTNPKGFDQPMLTAESPSPQQVPPHQE